MGGSDAHVHADRDLVTVGNLELAKVDLGIADPEVVDRFELDDRQRPVAALTDTVVDERLDALGHGR